MTWEKWRSDLNFSFFGLVVALLSYLLLSLSTLLPDWKFLYPLLCHLHIVGFNQVPLICHTNDIMSPALTFSKESVPLRMTRSRFSILGNMLPFVSSVSPSHWSHTTRIMSGKGQNYGLKSSSPCYRFVDFRTRQKCLPCLTYLHKLSIWITRVIRSRDNNSVLFIANHEEGTQCNQYCTDCKRK